MNNYSTKQSVNKINSLYSDEVLVTTALLYLLDSLDRQTFEESKELIDYAKQFGARQDDISSLIRAYLNNQVSIEHLKVNQDIYLDENIKNDSFETGTRFD